MKKVNDLILKKHSRKLVFKFLFYYILILMLPISIGSIAYMKASSIVDEEVKNSKIQMLRQESHELDARLKEVQQTALQISMNYTVQNFLNVSGYLSENEIYKAHNVTRDLLPYKNNNYFIYDFYIYYKNSNRIITSDSVYVPEFYYENYYGYNDMTYEAWYENMLNGVYYNKYLASSEMVNEQLPKRMITYLQTIPITEGKNPSALLVMLIDEDQIKKGLNDISAGGISYIVNNKNEIIVTTDSIKNISLPDVWNTNSDEGLLEQKINGKDMVIAYATSKVTNWKYVSILPKTVFMNKVNYIRNMTLVIVGICLGVGILISWLLACKSYNPIRSISDMLVLNMEDKPVNAANELEFIKEAVANTIHKNRTLEESYRDVVEQNQKIEDIQEKNRPMVKNTLLNKLVKGSVDDLENFKNYLQFYDVSFPYPLFSVLLFYIEDFNSLKMAENDIKSDRIKFAIISIVEELANQYGKSCMVEQEQGMMALIINFKGQTQIVDAKEEMVSIALRIKEFIEKKLEIILTIGIGNVYNGLENICTAYNDAQRALEYRIIKGSSSIIKYDEIISRDKDYYYPMDYELQLINSVKAGELSKCQDLFEKLFDENFKTRKLPIKLVKCLFFDIMSTAVKILDEISVNYSQIFGEAFDPLDKLTGCETVNEMHDEIKGIYIGICKYVDEHKVSHNNKLCNAVIQYINDCYTDENMSQSLIASHFNITTTYLSKLFKQETGQNMVDYINRLRVEKAKELLIHTGQSSAMIARQVGCTDDKSLIRIFKQYEGITPGKYRTSIQMIQFNYHEGQKIEPKV